MNTVSAHTNARLVVLISGRGSNMRAIINACKTGSLAADTVAVISNRPAADGLEVARRQGITIAVVDHQQYATRDAFDRALAATLDQFNPDWVALAGFMRILGDALVQRYLGRMVNIHPSLLPRYPGLNTHARAIAAGDPEHGASVHFVTPELDCGPVILQSKVPVLDNDTAANLARRVLAQEYELYVKALQWCVSGRARYLDGRCKIDNERQYHQQATDPGPCNKVKT